MMRLAFPRCRASAPVNKAVRSVHTVFPIWCQGITAPAGAICSVLDQIPPFIDAFPAVRFPRVLGVLRPSLRVAPVFSPVVRLVVFLRACCPFFMGGRSRQFGAERRTSASEASALNL